MECRRTMMLGVCLVLGSVLGEAVAGDEIAKLTISGPFRNDKLGVSVDIDAGLAVVGKLPTLGSAAYVFDALTGEELSVLRPEDSSFQSRFGTAVAIDESIALVGASFDDDLGTNSGSVYVFDAVDGRQIRKITPSDGTSFDYFGSSLAMGGGLAVVGSRLDDESGRGTGAAYVFDVSSGAELAKLLANDAALADGFGVSVAIDEGVVLVGAYEDDDLVGNSGSAYLFDAVTGTELAKLLPSDGTHTDLFGRSVAINDGLALVGAVSDNDNGRSSGSAYVFDIATGRELWKLLPDDGEADDFFGVSVAIEGNTGLVGAYRSGAVASGAGSAYLFDLSTGEQTGRLDPSDAGTSDNFGFAVSLDGGLALIGSIGNDDPAPNAGAAYVFDTTIPEPTSAVLTAIACLAAGRRRSHRAKPACVRR